METRQIQAVEGGHRTSDSIEGEPRELRPLEGEIEEVCFLEDGLNETAIFEVVSQEIPRGLAIKTLDLLDPILRLILDELPPPEQLTRDGIEPKVFEAPSRVSKSVDPVEHRAPWKPRYPFPSRRRRLENRRAITPPPKREKQVQLLTSLLQKVQVEIDDVPADYDVGIDVAQPREESFDQAQFVVVHRVLDPFVDASAVLG